MNRRPTTVRGPGQLCYGIERDDRPIRWIEVMIDLLKHNQETIKAICEEYGVLRLEVFGSAARGDFVPETSDLDFVVEFLDYGPGIAKRYFGFIRAMEAQFGRKVDTVFGPTMKNPIFQEEVDRSRELIYESTSGKVAA